MKSNAFFTMLNYSKKAVGSIALVAGLFGLVTATSMRAEARRGGYRVVQDYTAHVLIGVLPAKASNLPNGVPTPTQKLYCPSEVAKIIGGKVYSDEYCSKSYMGTGYCEHFEGLHKTVQKIQSIQHEVTSSGMGVIGQANVHTVIFEDGRVFRPQPGTGCFVVQEPAS